MVVPRQEAENLIIEAYVQLAEPLRRLYNMIPKNITYSTESKQNGVISTYISYCSTLGIQSIDGDIRGKVNEHLRPDLRTAEDTRILDMLMICREMARLCGLRVYNEIPDDPVIKDGSVAMMIYNLNIIAQQVNSYIPQFGSNTPLFGNNTRLVIPIVGVSLDRGANHAPVLLPSIGNYFDNYMLDIAISREKHFERNKYQRRCAPPNRFIMEVFRRIGLFKDWGPTGTHNFPDNAPDTKWCRSFWLFNIGLNHDYRGVEGTEFSGMQFIYRQPEVSGLQSMPNGELLNECIKGETDRGDIVKDKINIGTYDYAPPSGGSKEHNERDVNPWLEWGNESGEDISEIIMPEDVLTRVREILEGLSERVNRRGTTINDDDAKTAIQNVVEFPPRPTM
jgi:hypothetical protein